ncbi:MAG: spondin domain-containing protein [Candidatus Caenarcaniphilales bacterium]|nr:spondin domain-containing protein [Candidatus Caenarcaniphilales bacterium]
MKKTNPNLNLFCLIALLALNISAVSAASFEVKVTNLTQSQSFTPIIVSSQARAVDIFNAGEAASSEIEAVAEGGDISSLQTLLEADSAVIDVQSSEGLLAAGANSTITVNAPRRARYINLAAMLIPTNDAFIGLNNYPAPRRVGGTATVYLNAYDAGTEVNDELCSSIPGPGFTECTENNTIPEPSGTDIGFIHIHNGIHGVGDLTEATRDWRGPVAKVEITRVR